MRDTGVPAAAECRRGHFGEEPATWLGLQTSVHGSYQGAAGCPGVGTAWIRGHTGQALLVASHKLAFLEGNKTQLVYCLQPKPTPGF